MQDQDALFLGIDASTQSLTAVVIDAGLTVRYETSVNFDSELPEFLTKGGAHRLADGLTVTAPPLMWIAALDLLLNRMKRAGVGLSGVRAISGSGQQHGSVYLNKSARKTLRNLKAGISLRDQLGGIFALSESPIWMDSSTTAQCREREAALGGAQAVANLTGSRAYERFTGNQIAKIYQTRPRAFEAADRISLVSSFMASVLIGDHAPIDCSDGSGMNLMDLRARDWSQAALDITAPGLRDKLGGIVRSHAAIGNIHGYYCKTHGFAADCMVISFSGDNPNSLAGLRLQRAGHLAVSLGTSDTVFGSLSNPTPSATEGHIFANPVEPEAYMALICYKNGSLTREDVRNRKANGRWEAFEEALKRTPPGNHGNVGFYIKESEITPCILKTGISRFDVHNSPVADFKPDVEIRAVVEGQFLSMRLHGASVGLKPVHILATGGASANKSITGILADVMGVPVFTADQTASAGLGAAYRALHGWQCVRSGNFVPFATVMANTPPFKKTAEPDAAAHGIYTAMLKRYAILEKALVGE